MEGRNWSLFEISETKSKLLDLKDQNQLTKFYGSSIYFTLNIALKPTYKFEFLKKKYAKKVDLGEMNLRRFLIEWR